MPQNGPRGKPATERRNCVMPARAMAAATTDPGGTGTGWPLTNTWIDPARLDFPFSWIRVTHGSSPGQSDRAKTAWRKFPVHGRPACPPTDRPVPSDVVMPRPSWPVASHTRSLARLGPINGSLSGVAARCPVQERMASKLVNPGRYSVARRSIRYENHMIHRAVFNIKLTRKNR